MSQGLDLDSIYNLRSNFILVGLTGETSSGCKDVANQLVKGFNNGENFTKPSDKIALTRGQFRHNAYRKHQVIYDFASSNFKPFIEIKYKDVLTLFLLKYSLEDLINFLVSKYIRSIFKDTLLLSYEFSHEINKILEVSNEFEYYSDILKSIDNNQNNSIGNIKNLSDLFFNPDFKNFSRKLHEFLGKNSDLLGKNDYTGLYYHKVFQLISDNLRKSGNPYDPSFFNVNTVFSIVKRIDEIICSYREQNEERLTHLVINSLKNPIEILFFKQKYSNFYCFAINKDQDELLQEHLGKFTMFIDYNREEIIKKLIKEEYDDGCEKEFFKQKVKDCLQLADIHINFISKENAEKNNQLKFIEIPHSDFLSKENASRLNKLFKETPGFIDKRTPDISWHDQLLKYVSLIYHPGLVTPTSEERCMQLAFTAKYNSGCISRKVGAAITDENFSIKAIGWNDAPEGQVPCALRNVLDLVNNDGDNLVAFSRYEREAIDQEFKETVQTNFIEKIEVNREILHGRNICYCFRSVKNSVDEGKNQVHTRSLHAEENAFLQLSKYGSEGIKNGYLFSTASPCELCSKKAYQLGIKVIYYIEPYPSISIPHILSAGTKPINEIILFNGAIGSAYHRLYHPMMDYKDELSLLLDQNIIDLTKKYKKENSEIKAENELLRAKNQELERKQNFDLK